MSQTCDEPYRFFFPIGLAYGFWGVAIWVLYGLHFVSFYPGALHPSLMIGGFLGSFAFGFLMTAVPRFTGSFPATRVEMALIAIPLLLILPLSFAAQTRLILLSLLLSFTNASYFVVVRWRQRKVQPPDPFILIGFSLGSAITGLTILLTAPANTHILQLGQILFQHASMLMLVLGVGTQLVPMLLGSVPIGGCPRSTHAAKNRFVYIGGVFICAFFLEALVNTVAGHFVETVIVGLICLRHWNLIHLPSSRSKLSWVLWVAAWSLFLGLLGATIFPSYSIHFLHLTFVGGLALMTLMVATRVVLAHGGFNLALETRLNSLFWIAGCILMAALTRVFAGFVPPAYSSHLLYAALMWLIGLGIWSIVFGTKILFTNA